MYLLLANSKYFYEYEFFLLWNQQLLIYLVETKNVTVYLISQGLIKIVFFSYLF